MIALTPVQQDILLHRLEVPDAIAESFEERDADEVDAAIAECEAYVRGGWLPKPADLTELEREVMRDLIDGSTWLDALEGDIGFGTSQQKFNRMRSIFGALCETMEIYKP